MYVRGGGPIQIHTGSDRHPVLATVHEIGHLLDNLGVDARASLDYASESGLILDEWRHAVETSRGFQQLTALMTAGYVTIVGSAGASVRQPVDRFWVEYALRKRELFARSYAQYIAVKSQDTVLMQSLNAIRSHPTDRAYARQWEDDDFLAIAASLDAVFRRLGWIV